MVQNLQNLSDANALASHFVRATSATAGGRGATASFLFMLRSCFLDYYVVTAFCFIAHAEVLFRRAFPCRMS